MDIEYFVNPVKVGDNFIPNPFNPASILGSLSALSHLSYEWYRDSVSTVPDHLHPIGMPSREQLTFASIFQNLRLR